MKEQAGIIPTSDSDKVVIVGQNEKKFETVNWEIKQQKGHTVFEINLETGDIKPAEFEQVDLYLHDINKQLNMHVQMAVIGTVVSSHEVKKKLTTKPNCIYISALNIQNAAKKFAKKAIAGGLLK